VVTLLDTSTILWTVGAPEELSAAARALILVGGLCLNLACLEVADPVSWWSGAPNLLVTSDRQIGASPERTIW
jgi:hypothetical protein